MEEGFQLSLGEGAGGRGGAGGGLAALALALASAGARGGRGRLVGCGSNTGLAAIVGMGRAATGAGVLARVDDIPVWAVGVGSSGA